MNDNKPKFNHKPTPPPKVEGALVVNPENHPLRPSIKQTSNGLTESMNKNDEIEG